MSKETIKNIFQDIVNQKNGEATQEIESKKFVVTKITNKNLEHLANFDLDESKEEAIRQKL